MHALTTKRTAALTSLRSHISELALRKLLRPKLNHQHSPEAQRRATELFSRAQRMPKGVTVESTLLGGRPVDIFRPLRSDASRAILYFHGGGFVVGSPRTHRVLTAYLARAAGCPVYSVDYRLAPEHVFPAALDDAVAAFLELSESIDAQHIAVAGDSAGACLSLGMMLQLKAQGSSLPACAMLFCPLTDMTLSGESVKRNRHCEPLLTREWLDINNEYYCADTPRDNPLLSPVFADLTGLPPMLIQAAGNDLLLDDARRVHAAAKDAGVDSKLEVFADLGHCFQLAPDLVPEAQRATAMAGAYIKVRQ
jgi:monoterpene epsilon-lactone hydrolase